MSVRSQRLEENDFRPMPEYVDAMNSLQRLGFRVSGRKDVIYKVVRANIAPAWFYNPRAEICIYCGQVDGIDPRLLGTEEGILLYPEFFGVFIHENLHSRFTIMNLKAILDRFGHRHLMTFHCLEEGRVESRGVHEVLKESDVLALQASSMSIVIKDFVSVIDEEAGQMTREFQSMKSAINLLGLMAARTHAGIIDLSAASPRILWDSLNETIGSQAVDLASIAREYATLHMESPYGNDGVRGHDLIKEWMKIEDSLLDQSGGGKCPPPEKPEKPEKPEESEENDQSESEDDESSESEEDGEGQSQDKGEDEDQGQDESESEGQGQDESDGDGEGEDEDEDNESDASSSSGDEKRNDDATANLGEYGKSDKGDTPAPSFEELLDMAIKTMEDSKEVTGKKVKEQLKAVHQATAEAHNRRKALNREAMKKW